MLDSLKFLKGLQLGMTKSSLGEKADRFVENKHELGRSEGE